MNTSKSHENFCPITVFTFAYTFQTQNVEAFIGQMLIYNLCPIFVTFTFHTLNVAIIMGHNEYIILL